MIDPRALVALTAKRDTAYVGEILDAVDKAFRCFAQLLFDLSTRHVQVNWGNARAWENFMHANLDYASEIAVRRRGGRRAS